jgi:hypothetical protein
MPAQPGQVADLIGMRRARAEPFRQVPSQVGSRARHGEPGRGQHPALSLPSAGARRQRAEEQRGRARLAYGVRETDPLLVGVQRRPVGKPGDRRRRGTRDPGGDEYPGGRARAAEHVQQDRRGPAAERQPDQRRVDGLAERDAVQCVGPRARWQRPHDGIGQPADHGVERVRALDALGEGRRAQ